MKHINKQQINQAFCIIIRLFFEKKEKTYFRKTLMGRKYSYLFMNFSKAVASDVRSLLPGFINQVGHKSLFGAFFDLKKFQTRKIYWKY